MNIKNSKKSYRFKNSSLLTNINFNCYLSSGLFKIIIIITLIFDCTLISIYYNMDYEIEKEFDKVEPNYAALNWKNIQKDFKMLANKYRYLITKEKNIDENSPIWMMWYQGIETAPPIVKACIQSVINNRAKHPVIIISKYSGILCNINILFRFFFIMKSMLRNYHSSITQCISHILKV